MTQSKSRKLVAIGAPGAVTDVRGRPLLDLRISVMDRCNFRCPYCMPRETYGEGYRFLPAAERLSFDEIVRLARQFAAEGVRKIRLTGGEPLLRTGIADLVGELSAIDGIDDLALTTNGVLLAQHAAELRAQGLARVTVSLDSIEPATFRRMSGGFDGLDRVLDGIRAALEAGLTPVKVNAVVQRGVNDGEALDLASHFRGTGVIVRFIEYMDVGSRNDWRPALVVPARELRDRIAAAWPLVPLAPAQPGEVAERYAYADGAGEIGFIASVTQPFCGGCTRARLSSDGVFYTCLFATAGTDFRAALRAGAGDEQLRRMICATWRAREDRYSELRGRDAAVATERKIEMYYIGG
ncbi:MAG: GTP 3',8-cyclase MoaA [Gammaproteobacteria bacterium]|nr:GTP 3',8-cyclase MoaA [Gammaproteobacteria bacterium]